MTSPLYKSPIPLNYLDTDTALTANSDVKVPSQKAVKAYADTKAPALTGDENYVTDAEKASLASLSGTNTGDEVVATQAEVATGTDPDKMVTPLGLSKFHIPPEGFLYNGKIVPSVASNNLTVAIKGLDGNDPSATNPVYVRIGDTVKSITSALSVTKNAGTNWFNAGATELATKEIDYFVYLGYNATDGVVIGFSRIPFAGEYSDFSTTSTNEKYCAISTITNAVAGDDYQNIGRFGATLSAGAGYTWSVPTFTNINLIQKAIYETRWLNYAPNMTGSGGSAGSYAVDRTLGKYKMARDSLLLSTHSRITNVGSWSGDLRMAIPFLPKYESTTMIMLGTLVANNANPLSASKGIAFLLDGATLIYFTAQVWNSYVQWSGVSAVDAVLLNGSYAI